MFDEIDKNNNYKKKNNEDNTTRIIVSPANTLNDDNIVDSIVPIENDRTFISIEENLDEDELILDGIKFKGIEDIAKDPIFLKIKSLKDVDDLALDQLSKDLTSKRPQFYE